MVGTGVGDALGASFEGWRRAEPRQIEAVADRLEVLAYTDDTHMMIGVAESLIVKKGFDGEHMALTFVTNYESEPFRGYGPGPPRLFRLIRAGEAWDKVAGRLYGGGSYGNGSAMRIAPIGIFYHDDLDRLTEVAAQSSLITHSHELGKAGAVLQACAVAAATSLIPPVASVHDDFMTRLSELPLPEVYGRKLGKIKELLTEQDRARIVAELGNGVEAFNSVPAAVYSFLRYPSSFEDAVLYAVSLGGDADTIGAMTGAISGAYLGIEAIPDKWKGKLENRQYIEELANRLWELKHRG